MYLKFDEEENMPIGVKNAIICSSLSRLSTVRGLDVRFSMEGLTKVKGRLRLVILFMFT